MKRLHLVSAAVIAAALLGAERLHATVILPVELPELVAEARTIVHGRVLAAEARLVDGERSIETLLTVAADDYLKGSLGSRVTIRVPGGQVGDLRQVVVGTPVLRTGDEVVLFLGGSGPSVPWILGLNQGVFRVRADGRAAARQKRFSDETRMVEPFGQTVRSMSSGPASAMPLDVFKARIRRLVQEGSDR